MPMRNSPSASPKPHPSKPQPCNMSQAKTEVALQFPECAAEVALQHSLFCGADVILTKRCAAASEKLQCNIEKAALQESGAFLPFSCGFQGPTFRHPRLGPFTLPALQRTFVDFTAELSHNFALKKGGDLVRFQWSPTSSKIQAGFR